MAFLPNFPKFIEILRDGEFTERQAMSIAKATNEIVVAELVTTDDLISLRREFKDTGENLETRFETSIRDAETRLETRFEKEIMALRHDLSMMFYRFGGIIVATIIGVAAVLKLLEGLN